MLYGLFGALAALFLLIGLRHYRLRREIRRLTVQLGELGANARYGRRLYMEANERAMAAAVVEINRLVDDYECRLRRTAELERNIRLSISGISHDLRTPLASLTGYVQLLRQAASPDKRQAHLEAIANAAKALQDLTERFYELSVLELNENSYALQPLNLEHAVCECFLGFHEEFGKRSLDLAIRDSDKPSLVLADPVALDRILRNMIQNLLRYAHGTATIAFAEEDGFRTVTIRNETVHPLPDPVERIFDRFYTGDQSRGGRGTGLGLYISRKLAEGMGGAITAAKDGRCLLMTVKLPSADEGESYRRV